MNCSELVIRPEAPADVDAITQLHEDAFGPGRFAKTAYRLREGAPAAAGLSLVAEAAGRLVGSLRFTAIRVGGRDGVLLLGPLVVDKDYTGRRCGLRLMGEGLELARALGFRLVILVGDLPYYQKAGFRPVPVGRMSLPGPVDYKRLLAAELVPAALDDYAGAVTL